MKKKPIIIIAILAILAALAVVVYVSQQKGRQSSGSVQQQDKTADGSKSIPSTTMASFTPPKETKAPSVFPSDLPIEEGAKVVQSFETTNPGTKEKIYTLVFVSSQSREAAIKSFKDYFESHGWTIIRTEDQKDSEGLYAALGKEKLTVFYNQKPAGNQNEISVTYTYPGK